MFKPDFTDFIWAKPFFSVPVTALDVYKENNGHRKRYKTIGTVLNRIILVYNFILTVIKNVQKHSIVLNF